MGSKTCHYTIMIYTHLVKYTLIKLYLCVRVGQNLLVFV